MDENDDRAARLAEALRANLKKRKAQARGGAVIAAADATAAGPGTDCADLPRD